MSKPEPVSQEGAIPEAEAALFGEQEAEEQAEVLPLDEACGQISQLRRTAVPRGGVRPCDALQRLLR